MTATEAHANLPGQQLSSIFETRRAIEEARPANERSWTGLETLVTALEALGERRPVTMRVETHEVLFIPTIERALGQIEPPIPDTTVVHTAGRPMWTPRIVVIDESRALLR